MNNSPPDIAEPSQPKFSREILWVALSFLIIAAVAFVLHYAARRSVVPPRSEFDFPGIVSVTVRTFETNSNGSVTASLAIRNNSDDSLEFGYATQIRAAQGWAHTNGNPAELLLRSEDDPRLPPGAERVVTVARPASGGMWRIVAVCWTPPASDRLRGPLTQYYSQDLHP